MVTTDIKVEILYTLDGLASIGDTTYLVAHYGNPARVLKLLRWFRQGLADPIRTVKPHSNTGTDTLVFICPSEAGGYDFRIEIADDGGNEKTVGAHLTVTLDPPTVQMPDQVTGSAGDPLRLQAAVHDGLGRIAKMEWDIGATGNWIPSRGNDTVITLPTVASRHTSAGSASPLTMV